MPDDLSSLLSPIRPRQPGQVPPDHPDAGKPVAWGEGQTIR